ncbi:dihydrolipoamide acetyltransferase family protein [Clostridiisalibacter paucivorans]|uniref:dihydrolipoamide acetyltransferase family protein n=1 Tax=Clostridiisalibacter paucivorans TaxID=408753 RepID=UPI00047A7E9E|nr:dihydrolipoamide acetyltransferase family protein [Clostridiisalibacter paucivorans]
MSKTIVMPKLGLTMKEGKLTKWHKKEGDEVKEGDILFDVETNKLSNEVEVKESGILRKVIIDEGEVVPCLEPVAIIADKDEDISAILAEIEGKKEGQDKEEKREVVEEKTDNNKEIKTKRLIASPAAKRIAKEKGIDISEVVGTGPNGRITIKDVENYETLKTKAPKSTPMARKVAKDFGIDLNDIDKQDRINKQDVYDLYREQELVSSIEPKEKAVPMSTMRKVIGDRMYESWQTSPVVNYNIRVDMTNLKKLKKELKNKVKLTYTDFLIKIVSKTLLEFPLLNCSIDGDDIITRNYVNMGVAVAIEEGLIVPVVKYAHSKGLKEISYEVRSLADKAKNNELTNSDIDGGTFTITNLGMFGIESFAPIINQPEVGILGVNAIVDTPMVENKEIVIKPLMNLSLTADHRAVDGAVAAKFMAKLKEYLENPGMLLL